MEKHAPGGVNSAPVLIEKDVLFIGLSAATSLGLALKARSMAEAAAIHYETRGDLCRAGALRRQLHTRCNAWRLR